MRSEGLLYSWKTFLRDAVIMLVGHNSKPRDLKTIAITWNHKHGTDCGIGCTLPTHITFSKYVDKQNGCIAHATFKDWIHTPCPLLAQSLRATHYHIRHTIKVTSHSSQVPLQTGVALVSMHPGAWRQCITMRLQVVNYSWKLCSVFKPSGSLPTSVSWMFYSSMRICNLLFKNML